MLNSVCIYDMLIRNAHKKMIINNKLEYDINSAYQAMQATSLIQGYHSTLKTGYWPSQETLPLSMRV